MNEAMFERYEVKQAATIAIHIFITYALYQLK